MAITTVSEFEESTAFERLVLDRLRPLISSEGTQTLDLRAAMAGTGPTVIDLSFTDSLSASAVESVTLDVMPLLFGAAWKVLDLLMELALHQAGIQPDRKTEYTIAAKVKFAKNGDGVCVITSTDQPLWTTLCAAYAATFEHRHCLVHRRAAFSARPLQLAGQSASGVPIKALDAAELEAFVAIAQIAGIAVIAGRLDTRRASHLRYELDRLQRHTGSPLLGGLKASQPVTLIVALTPAAHNQFEIDFAQVHAMAKERMPNMNFDVWLDVPNGSGQTLFAHLEDLPTAKTMIDLGALPPNLSFR